VSVSSSGLGLGFSISSYSTATPSGSAAMRTAHNRQDGKNTGGRSPMTPPRRCRRLSHVPVLTSSPSPTLPTVGRWMCP